MSVSWSENDFRVARMTLIGVSAASFVPLIAGEASALAVLAAGCIHLGLVASLAFERHVWLVRLFGAVLLFPSSMIAAVLGSVAIRDLSTGGGEPVLLVPALAFALSHAAQFWRLAGLPIPPLHPLTAPEADQEDGRDRHTAREG
ncbi:MAG TPA: hypothetical protein VF710_07275 [Longimicrobium sp.]|jgi:hypothetical protein